MKRSLLPLVVVPALVAGAAGTSLSGAAFVDTVDAPTMAGADSVSRWLELVKPAAGTDCAPAAGITVDGADGVLALKGAAAAARSLNCAFMVRVREDLPEGLQHVTVSTAVEGSSVTDPLLDGSKSVTLDAGEARPLRLTVAPGATGRVVLTVTPPGEEAGFLRYDVPVQLGTAPDGGEGGGSTPTTPGDTGAGSGTGTTTTQPSTGQPAPSVSEPLVQLPPALEEEQQSQGCSSNRAFWVSVRWPKRLGLRKVRVTVAGKRVKVVRRKGRLQAKVDLRGRSAGQVRVVLSARTKSGRFVRDVRSYRTCAPGTAAAGS